MLFRSNSMGSLYVKRSGNIVYAVINIGIFVECLIYYLTNCHL